VNEADGAALGTGVARGRGQVCTRTDDDARPPARVEEAEEARLEPARHRVDVRDVQRAEPGDAGGALAHGAADEPLERVVC
jgi:hypothetical protein